MTADTLPTVTPADVRAHDDQTDITTWGILLAAGESTRFGEANKLLATLNGTPLVRHAAATLAESSLDGVTVVVGHECGRVRAAVDDLPVDVRYNPTYDRGQSTSVREGVRAARDHNADGVLFALGDMPAVAVASVDALLEAATYGVADALVVACDGIRGNPVWFDKRFFSPLEDVKGDVGGRDLLTAERGAVAVETGDPGVLQDIDRPADLNEVA